MIKLISSVEHILTALHFYSPHHTFNVFDIILYLSVYPLTTYCEYK